MRQSRVAIICTLALLVFSTRLALAGGWNWARLTVDHMVVETHADGHPQVAVRFNDYWNPDGCPDANYQRFWLDTPMGKSLFAMLLEARALGIGVARAVEGCTPIGAPRIVAVSW